MALIAAVPQHQRPPQQWKYSWKRLMLVSSILIIRAQLGVCDTTSTFQALKDWVISEGAVVNVVLGEGGKGLRASTAINAHGQIMAIPSKSLLFIYDKPGSETSLRWFIYSTMVPDAKWKPYLDFLLDQEEAKNACVWPEEYIHMMVNGKWADNIRALNTSMEAILNEEINDEEETVQETVGRTISREEMRKICSWVLSRGLKIEDEESLDWIIAPIFESVAHVPGCPHYLIPDLSEDSEESDDEYSEPGQFMWIAGRDVQEGEELCYDFGDQRDDVLAFRYGYLSKLAGRPPKLTYREIENPKKKCTGIKLVQLDEKDQHQLKVEAQRLKFIQTFVTKTGLEKNPFPKPVSGYEDVHQMLTELHRRRAEAIRAEISRLEALIK